MMLRMLLSSSCVLVFLLCLSHEYCNARHLSTIDDHEKLLSHSTIKGLGNDPLKVHDDLNLESTMKERDQADTIDHNDHYTLTDCRSKKKKAVIKDQKVKKSKEHVHRHERKHYPKSMITFQVPPKNKQVHQQPGFNLDYSPPKTHPPSHN